MCFNVAELVGLSDSITDLVLYDIFVMLYNTDMMFSKPMLYNITSVSYNNTQH